MVRFEGSTYLSGSPSSSGSSLPTSGPDTRNGNKPRFINLRTRRPSSLVLGLRKQQGEEGGGDEEVGGGEKHTGEGALNLVVDAEEQHTRGREDAADVVSEARASAPEQHREQRRQAHREQAEAALHDGDEGEHFWIVDVSYKNGVFSGKIGNDPGIVRNVKLGQTWEIKKEEISDWMYTKGDLIHGGFTIDPLLGSFPKEKADALRSKLVR